MDAPPGAAGDSSPVVAHLDGTPITAAELETAAPGGRRLEPRRALDAVIGRKLAAREARRRGLADTEAVQAEIAALRREAAAREEAVLRDALAASLRGEVALSEADLRAYYEKTKVRHTERRLRLRRVAYPSAEAAREADAALGVAGRLDPAASEEIGPASVAQLPDTVLPETLRLREAGERTVVERDGGAALVELVEILPAEPLPFEAVRPQLEAELRRLRGTEAARELFTSLYAEARIEIDEAALRELTGADGPGAAAPPAAER